MCFWKYTDLQKSAIWKIRRRIVDSGIWEVLVVDSEIREVLLVESGIRDQLFCLWNPESLALESGISPTIGVRNPSPPLETGIQCLESEIHDVESGTQDNLGFPYIWVEYAHHDKRNIFRHFNCWLQFPWKLTFSPGHRVFFLLTSTSFFDSIMRSSVANSMLLVAMLTVCVHRKWSNKRLRGINLTLRVQEWGKSQHRLQNPRLGSFLSSLVFPYFDRKIEQDTMC